MSPCTRTHSNTLKTNQFENRCDEYADWQIDATQTDIFQNWIEWHSRYAEHQFDMQWQNMRQARWTETDNLFTFWTSWIPETEFCIRICHYFDEFNFSTERIKKCILLNLSNSFITFAYGCYRYISRTFDQIMVNLDMNTENNQQ